jgi:hypothetical protein
MYIRVPPVVTGSVPPGGTVLEQSVPPCDNSSGPRKFAMLPWEVCSDPRLTHRDIHVYCVLSASRRGAVAKVGMRRLAEGCHVGYRKIGRVLAKLQLCGHIDFRPVGPGRRGEYTLTSPVFAAEQKRPRSARGDRKGRPSVRSAARMWAEDASDFEAS